MWKKCEAIACMLTILSIFTVFSVSASPSVTVILDGLTLNFDVPPTIVDGRTMIPMRIIFEAQGADVEWDGTTRTITATRGDLVVRTVIDDNVIDVNGNKIMMDVAPLIKDGRTLVPVRFVSEALGSEVVWDASTRTVIINSQVITDEPDDYLPSELDMFELEDWDNFEWEIIELD
ncbi:MAG: copper amine oxidase N-terminal domain-containing protein [Defluviitaleaceae bacterium]|nr:copper amine oxidase N-terminal domain-containing protein [Defluviitaleaceae bacterium]